MSNSTTSSKGDIKLENVLIVGNGGRENSLAWAIQKNELVKKVFLVPGNAGSERINKCERIRIDINNKNELVEKLDFLKIFNCNLLTSNWSSDLILRIILFLGMK